MKSATKQRESVLYPPLSEELKARMRKAGHGDMIAALDTISEKTIEGLMRAARSGTAFSPKTAKRAA